MASTSHPYALAIVRAALGSIVSEASREGTGFEDIERSASEALLDVLTRYIRTIGTVSNSAARHAGRSESNYADVRLALDEMHADPAPALLRFLQKVPEGSLLQDVAMFPVGHASQVAMVRPASSRHGGVRPQHIPDYLPAFPEPCTYQSTITRNQRMQDEAHAKKKRSQHKRQVTSSVTFSARQFNLNPVHAQRTPPGPAAPRRAPHTTHAHRLSSRRHP
jgi:transcription initiation factor TFIID subunit 8